MKRPKVRRPWPHSQSYPVMEKLSFLWALEGFSFRENRRVGDKVRELAESQEPLRGLVSGPVLIDTIVTTGIIWSESLAFGKLVLGTYQTL